MAAGGTVDIWVEWQMSAGAWGTIDDFSFTFGADLPNPDRTALQNLAEQAGDVDRADVNAASWRALSAALTRAAFALASPAPSQATVDGAAQALSAALAGLQPGSDVPVAGPVAVTVTDGSPVVLPATVTVENPDGTTEEQGVTWSGAQDWIASPGVYTVSGVTAGGLPVVATITVTERTLLSNPGFEEDDTTPWRLTGTGAQIAASSDANSGARALTFFDPDAFAFSLAQTVDATGFGECSVTVVSQGGGVTAGDIAQVTVTSSLGSASADLAFTGWRQFTTASTPAVAVGSDGQVVVSVTAALTAGAWGSIDDFAISCIPVAAADTTELAALVAQANAVERELYTSASLAELDQAVEIAAVVLAAQRPTTATVEAATIRLSSALDDLALIDDGTDNGGGTDNGTGNGNGGGTDNGTDNGTGNGNGGGTGNGGTDNGTGNSGTGTGSSPSAPGTTDGETVSTTPTGGSSVAGTGTTGDTGSQQSWRTAGEASTLASTGAGGAPWLLAALALVFGGALVLAYRQSRTDC